MTPELREMLGGWQRRVETELADHLPLSSLPGAGRLNDAVRDAVFPGGRRWRPALTLLGAHAAGVPLPSVLDVACGVELVHTASLVFDDLPGMDDGRERRGKPTLHLVHGEGVAVLAALALLNRGYEIFATTAAPGSEGAQRLLAEATRAVGADGMIGGQAADLAGGDRAPLWSRQKKTTTLVRLAVVAGAIAGGASDGDVEALGRYGESLGAAYQMHDDVLDAGEPGGPLGKTLGQDARHGRGSWAEGGRREGALAAARLAAGEARSVILARFGDTAPARLLLAAADAILDLMAGSAVPARAQ